jgi:hypothetical protein
MWQTFVELCICIRCIGYWCVSKRPWHTSGQFSHHVCTFSCGETALCVKGDDEQASAQTCFLSLSFVLPVGAADAAVRLLWRGRPSARRRSYCNFLPREAAGLARAMKVFRSLTVQSSVPCAGVPLYPERLSGPFSRGQGHPFHVHPFSSLLRTGSLPPRPHTPSKPL